MKVWIVVLNVFGYIWLSCAVLLILAGIAGTWMKGGFSAVQDLLSPFNVVNWVSNRRHYCAGSWRSRMGRETQDQESGPTTGDLRAD